MTSVGEVESARTEWPRFPPLEPLEFHSGLVLGPRLTPLPPEDAIPVEELPLRDVLEEIALEAISRPPCLVAFSGGRDSSALLCLATHVARKHGFQDPIPITYVFDEHPRSQEPEWQDLVVRHLGLKDWEVLPGGDRLDALGDLVRRTLRRHGLYWPPNLHSLLPLLEAARGGSLIMGKGGDEVFSPAEAPPSFSWMVARAQPWRRGINYAISGLLPRPLGLRFKYRNRLALPWLRRPARREIRRLFFKRFEETLTQQESLEEFNRSRYMETFAGVAGILAGQEDVRLINPFLHPRFFGAWIRHSPPQGYPSRAAALDATFGDLLPRATVRRSTKAVFTEVFWGPGCREFASRWDGTGLDPSLVRVEALRREWRKSPPDFRAVAPLQAAWLASVIRDP